jgi:hypothetical protein
VSAPLQSAVLSADGFVSRRFRVQWQCATCLFILVRFARAASAAAACQVCMSSKVDLLGLAPLVGGTAGVSCFARRVLHAYIVLRVMWALIPVDTWMSHGHAVWSCVAVAVHQCGEMCADSPHPCSVPWLAMCCVFCWLPPNIPPSWLILMCCRPGDAPYMLQGPAFKWVPCLACCCEPFFFASHPPNRHMACSVHVPCCSVQMN